jgi:hypothetical protein
MTMHLEGPWLSTTGKIRSKRRRYASADAARKERELRDMWLQKQAEWTKMAPNFSGNKTISVVVAKTNFPTYKPPPGRETPHIPSLNNGVDTSPAVRSPDKVYTGTKIKGIGTMHKSNAVPIFSDDEAVDIAHMRR